MSAAAKTDAERIAALEARLDALEKKAAFMAGAEQDALAAMRQWARIKTLGFWVDENGHHHIVTDNEAEGYYFAEMQRKAIALIREAAS